MSLAVAKVQRRYGSAVFKFLLALVLLVLPLLTVQSVRMGHEVVQRLDELSTAATDNMQWVLSQAEVDFLKLDAAVHAVKTPADLYQLRRQFDIYYSRIDTFQESPLFTDLRENTAGGRLLERLWVRLEALATLIDVDDADLMQNLPQISQKLADNGDDVRELALFGVVIQVEATETKRLHLFSILLRLAWVVLALFLALAVTALLLGWMYRRGRVLAAERSKAASRMEAMISSSLDAILVVGKNNKIQAFNGAAEAIFGYSRDEAIGAAMDELIIPPHLREAHRAGMTRFLKTGEARVAGAGRIQLEAQRKSGEIFPVEVSLSISRSQADQVFVGFIRDISDRVASEEELRRARDDALAGERAKANLLTVMSHEMRTPLTGVLGAIDLLEGTHPDAEQSRYLNAMRVSGELLLHHVNDVLQLSSLEAGVAPEKLQIFDLKELISGLVESQQANAHNRGNTLTLQINIAGGEMVAGRPRALQQALLNLIGNAIKFTSNGAVLVDVMRGSDQGMVEFHVSDTGHGIGSQDLERIFEDFITLDSSFKRGSEGTGLGLAITRRIVQVMGGTITCESEPGEGSLFSLILPLPTAQMTAQAGSGSGRMSPPRPTGSKGTIQVPRQTAAEICEDADGPNHSSTRILVVEDNDINRELLQHMLQRQGHFVITASGGAEAVEACRQDSFDLILMDISMPEVDGIEAIRRIRAAELAPGIDIVALTAHTAPEDHARILKAGFVEVVTKPVSSQGLTDLIASRTGSATGAADLSQRSDILQFFEALGAERARGFLQGYDREVESFLETLLAASELTTALRSEAHKLAGSAAVLGLSSLRTCLLEVEMATEMQALDRSAMQQCWQKAKALVLEHC